jgi:hypothetical protein
MTKTTLVWSNINKNRQEAGKLAAFAGFFAQPFTVDIGDTSSSHSSGTPQGGASAASGATTQNNSSVSYPSYIELDAQGKPKIGGLLYIIGALILIGAVASFCIGILLMMENSSLEGKSLAGLMIGIFIIMCITFYLFINKRMLFRLIYSLLTVFDVISGIFLYPVNMLHLFIAILIKGALIYYLYTSKRVNYTFINK